MESTCCCSDAPRGQMPGLTALPEWRPFSMWHSCQMFGCWISHNKHSGKLTVNLISAATIMRVASGGCFASIRCYRGCRQKSRLCCVLGGGLFERKPLKWYEEVYIKMKNSPVIAPVCQTALIRQRKLLLSWKHHKQYSAGNKEKSWHMSLRRE